MVSNQPNGKRHELQAKEELEGAFSFAAILSQDSRYQLSLDNLPERANREAICRYLATLQETNADAGIILYTDESGCRKIASYDKRGTGQDEEIINIQSTTKAIFSLYLVDLLKDELWNNMDCPVATLLPDGLLAEKGIAAEFDPELRSRGLEESWDNCTLRRLLNHASGIAFNEKVLVAENASTLSTEYTRYSNIGVELVSIVVKEWMQNQNSGETFSLHDSANSFLEKHFVSPIQVPNSSSATSMKFSLYKNVDTGFCHTVGSGKLDGTVSQVAALPVVVRSLDPKHVEKLFTPISEHARNLKSGIKHYEELKKQSGYWGNDLNPDIIANLFFLRSYGYATRGSLENNCDVVVQDYCASSESSARAACILNNPYFTVVRLQKAESESQSEGLPPDHGALLQTLLGNFFKPDTAADGSKIKS
jgi:hypothetical protein